VWTWKESLALDTYSLFSYYLCTSCTLTDLSGLTYLVVHICWTFACSNLQTQKMPFNTQLQQQQTPFLLHHPQIKLYAQSQLLAYLLYPWGKKWLMAQWVCPQLIASSNFKPAIS
jgi:hypothetical protein